MYLLNKDGLGQPPRMVMEDKLIDDEIKRGTSVKDLTNKVFWHSHPELRGCRLPASCNELKQLQKEWKRIHARVATKKEWGDRLKNIPELGNNHIGKPGPLNQDPVDLPTFLIAKNRIKTQLQRNFQADDERGFLDRRQRLREAFNLVPKSFASVLLERLTFESNDPLTRLFRFKIATATRNEMLRILQRKLEI
jgi:hypothetical protein